MLQFLYNLLQSSILSLVLFFFVLCKCLCLWLFLVVFILFWNLIIMMLWYWFNFGGVLILNMVCLSFLRILFRLFFSWVVSVLIFFLIMLKLMSFIKFVVYSILMRLVLLCWLIILNLEVFLMGNGILQGLFGRMGGDFIFLLYLMFLGVNLGIYFFFMYRILVFLGFKNYLWLFLLQLLQFMFLRLCLKVFYVCVLFICIWIFLFCLWICFIRCLMGKCVLFKWDI